MRAVVNAPRIQGATLGNDVNLRDVEGRSALLLGRAKDNNASAARPDDPPVRRGFGLEDVRRAGIILTISGRDGFTLEEGGAIGAISRDRRRWWRRCSARITSIRMGGVYLGTPSPPPRIAARGHGLHPQEGDVVRLASPRLGPLVTRWTATMSARLELRCRRPVRLAGAARLPRV